MDWWNFQDLTFLSFFIITCLMVFLFLFFIISFLVSERKRRKYIKDIYNEKQTTRIYMIDVKKNLVSYFNRSDITHKKEMELADFYNQFHHNDIEKIKNWIFQICVDPRKIEQYLEVDMVINRYQSYYTLLKLLKYDPKVAIIHLESHQLKSITPINHISKNKKHGVPIGVVKRSIVDQMISKNRSLRGFTFAIRFFYIKQKVLSNEKIERYMVMTLKNEIYPFAKDQRTPRQILEISDSELILFDLRIASKDEAMVLATSLERALKKSISVNGFADSINFAIGVIENSQYYQDFDTIVSKAQEACMSAQQNDQSILLYQKSAGQMLELDKYSEEIEQLLSKKNLRFLFRPIVDVPHKRAMGYFSYVKGYDTLFATYSEMSKYAAKVGKNRELFALVAKTVLPKFENERRYEYTRLFFSVSLFDIDHMISILPQIPSSKRIKLVLMFEEQEINENSSQLDLLDNMMKKLRNQKYEIALLLKDRNLLLNSSFYNNFDYFVAGAAMIGEIKKNNRVRLSIHTLIEQLLKYKRPIIATDLEGWQAIELIIKSGITIVSSDTISPSNDMLLPIEKKKIEKLVSME